jgi:hypothetical protein
MSKRRTTAMIAGSDVANTGRAWAGESPSNTVKKIAMGFPPSAVVAFIREVKSGACCLQ